MKDPRDSERVGRATTTPCTMSANRDFLQPCSKERSDKKTMKHTANSILRPERESIHHRSIRGHV
ncbi:hypothetical protein OAF30_00380 [Flavobacteriales bacterium]|nr:hypothetical protein [Flavobacteriales bacterium]